MQGSPLMMPIKARRPKKMKHPSIVLSEAKKAQQHINEMSFLPESVEHIKSEFNEPSRAYYALAAMSRRAVLEEEYRDSALEMLFPLRSAIEQKIIEALGNLENPLEIALRYGCKSFFGKSIKQGISIRYPLSTCVPTQKCGGRCYAHDGRDRDFQRLFRGALNGFVGLHYEDNERDRPAILAKLSKQIDEVIEMADAEAQTSRQEGFKRRPRIRFSHVGEMAATPVFTNDLATEINRRSPDISCVIYTRHPDAQLLDENVFVLNFTIEGHDDPRSKYRPSSARLVSSSWDGAICEEAEINFLEHHVEKFSALKLGEKICPVTANHSKTPTCDSARCEKCFIS